VTSRTIHTTGLSLIFALATLPLTAAPRSGKIAGLVVDSSGTPQMGATVAIAAEQLRGSGPLEVLTDEQGHFSASRLAPSIYSVRVTLAGFLPSIEQHIRVGDQGTTLLNIELGSIFSSLDRLRRQPSQSVDADEWSWVLRTSGATRPVLRWNDGEVMLGGVATGAEAARNHQPRGQIQLTAGARHPGSVSNVADSPATAFAYDQGIGSSGRLLFAGQFGYESATASGGFATVWLPSGDASRGSVTSLIVRQSQLGPEGMTFRGLRVSHDGQLELSDSISIHYGAEYLLAGLGATTSSLRPRGEITLRVSPTWRAALILAARPWPDSRSSTNNVLDSTLDSLDSFPTLLYRGGRPVLEGGWHEEMAVEHSFGPKASLMASVFRDRSSHAAVFGRGSASNADFLQDFLSNGFAYDAGDSGSWGTRLAYQQKFTDNLEAALVYAYAGALAVEPGATPDEGLREALETRCRHSLAARVSTRLPHTRTQLAANYKWIDGRVVSRQDAYGEAAFRLDPYLNMVVRQPLPNFIPGHLVALADFGNLLAQGYVPVTTRDGRVLLVPSYRSFRGGVIFQF
jgi:hypothetical protein